MFDDSLYGLIVRETNKQAEKVFFEHGASEHSRITHWKPLTTQEFKVFLGLLFHMGTIHLSRLEDYWKTDRLFNIPCFREHMGRDRFLSILRCLHFAENPTSAANKPEDRLVFASTYQISATNMGLNFIC